ncbi:ATP-binding protein [Actinocorallia populi]|uniref:ATP-binding protein n=1 Tax=Actinocorallia populi TaxID=2079200 RepID=UPI000D08762E|nr:AAA family ATPase [Actinocorallia populi]
MTHTAERSSGNLPAEISSFVGRPGELDRLTALLHRSRLVTVTGIGGVGKTRTALRAAELAGSRFPDGVWLVDLSGLQDPDLLPHTVAHALGVRDQGPRRQLEVLADFLAERSLLLVLDTCEHLTDACAALAETLLSAAPDLHVLTTGRRPLGAAGEQIVVVEPLPVPPEAETAHDGVMLRRDADALLDHASVALFVDRARAIDPAFSFTGTTPAAVARLCRRLDGIPLAIELAAVWLRTLTAEELADRLARRFSLLTGGERGMARHETLHAAIGWSHELLSPPERLLWARLSVFPRCFDTASAVRVCADERLPASWIPRLLKNLVEASILLREEYGGPFGDGARYRLPSPVRGYGAGWLAELGEREHVQRLHRDHFLELARRYDAEWHGPLEIMWCERMQRELPSIRAALEFCLERPAEHTAGLEIFGGLFLFWLPCGHIREGRLYAERLLALDPAPGPGLTRVLWVVARLATAQGDIEAGMRYHDRCLRHARRQGDPSAMAMADYVAATTAMIRGEFAASVRLLESAAAQYERNGEQGDLTMTYFLHALVLVLRGDTGAAVAMSDRCRSSALRHLDGWGLSFADYVRALAEVRRGDTAAAVEYGRAALRFKAKLSDTVGCAMVVDVLSLAAALGGDAERGARLLGLGQKIWRTFGTPSIGSADLRRIRDLCEELARGRLGAHAYEQEFAAGRALNPERGFAYAMGEDF